jgi:Zn/Cd-binding protein ZinT
MKKIYNKVVVQVLTFFLTIYTNRTKKYLITKNTIKIIQSLEPTKQTKPKYPNELNCILTLYHGNRGMKINYKLLLPGNDNLQYRRKFHQIIIPIKLN